MILVWAGLVRLQARPQGLWRSWSLFQLPTKVLGWKALLDSQLSMVGPSAFPGCLTTFLSPLLVLLVTCWWALRGCWWALWGAASETPENHWQCIEQGDSSWEIWYGNDRCGTDQLGQTQGRCANFLRRLCRTAFLSVKILPVHRFNFFTPLVTLSGFRPILQSKWLIPHLTTSPQLISKQ